MRVCQANKSSTNTTLNGHLGPRAKAILPTCSSCNGARQRGLYLCRPSQGARTTPAERDLPLAQRASCHEPFNEKLDNMKQETVKKPVHEGNPFGQQSLLTSHNIRFHTTAPWAGSVETSNRGLGNGDVGNVLCIFPENYMPQICTASIYSIPLVKLAPLVKKGMRAKLDVPLNSRLPF